MKTLTWLVAFLFALMGVSACFGDVLSDAFATVAVEGSNSREEIRAIWSVIFNRMDRYHLTLQEAICGRKAGPFYGYRHRAQAWLPRSDRHSCAARLPVVEEIYYELREGRLSRNIPADYLFFDSKFYWGKKIGKQYFTNHL